MISGQAVTTTGQHELRLDEIEGSCDGPLQHATGLKHVRSIFERMWGQDDQDAACAAFNHVTVWVFTTDQGPDQVAAAERRGGVGH